jgi:hypothetical protein
VATSSASTTRGSRPDAGSDNSATLDATGISAAFAGQHSAPTGLSGAEAKARFAQHGPNVVKAREESRWHKLVYHRSGMLGLSGIKEDMRELQASSDPRAIAAIDCFVYIIVMVGSYVSVLGGLDALVFTAGIGENSVPVRAGLSRALGWLGVALDDCERDERPAHLDRRQPHLRLGHPHRRGTDDRPTYAGAGAAIAGSAAHVDVRRRPTSL